MSDPTAAKIAHQIDAAATMTVAEFQAAMRVVGFPVQQRAKALHKLALTALVAAEAEDRTDG